MTARMSITASRKLAAFVLIFILSVGLLQAAAPAGAQSAAPVQEIYGKVNPGERDVYLLAGLKQGQTLYATLHTTDGNLDPALSLLPGSADLPALVAGYEAALQALMQTAEHPLVELPGLNDRTFLAWNDDSGNGYDAALQYTIPADGDYILGVSGALSSAGRITSGSYRLVVGLDAPEVLQGTAVPNGALIAEQDNTLLVSDGRVQEYRGQIESGQELLTVKLHDFDAGETLFLFAEATSGDLTPVLVLRDFGGKPVGVSNLQGEAQQAKLEYTFPEKAEFYSLDIYAAPEGAAPAGGEFRLLAGVDAPRVLSGAAEANDQSVLRLPIEVLTGLKLQQIVNIDQSSEIMTIVGTIKLQWKDPRLAFSPDSCNCQVKEYSESRFNQFLEDTGGDWPDFTFFNQQGNRWTQNRVVEVLPDGSVTYQERFTTNFQLDFDFSQYPFDTEHFYIHADMLFPEDRYVMKPMDDFSSIDSTHGEDEFIITGFDTSISSVMSSRDFPTSRFTFHFSAPRFQTYYLFRIFIPILLIISVSYVTFFLKDYTRRIEVATGNLLLFIAFSWSLAEDYPRMGYLTFLDAIMAITFVVNTLVVIYNVYLKWLENHEQVARADRIDEVADWVYPIGYFVLFGLTYVAFFWV